MHNDERIMCVFIEAQKKNIFIAIIIVIIMITAN